MNLQKQAGLFDYTLAQRTGDAVKSDPIGIAKDGFKAVTGVATALTGGTICGTSLVGCAAGGPMAALGTSDAVEGVTGLTNAMLGYGASGFNPIKYGLNEIMPVWGNAAYDGLNLTFNLLAMRARVPLKLGLADGLDRPSSIFGVTVSQFNNPKLVQIINWSLPNGTAQNTLLMGAGAKAIGLANDINNAGAGK